MFANIAKNRKKSRFSRLHFCCNLLV